MKGRLLGHYWALGTVKGSGLGGAVQRGLLRSLQGAMAAGADGGSAVKRSPYFPQIFDVSMCGSDESWQYVSTFNLMGISSRMTSYAGRYAYAIFGRF